MAMENKCFEKSLVLVILKERPQEVPFEISKTDFLKHFLE